MKSIGGYFGLELGKGEPLHPTALRLNSGRNALEYIINARGYRVLHAPAYSCGVLRTAIDRTGVELRTYALDRSFDPIMNVADLAKEEGFLYINYFGLKTETALRLSKECSTLIMDHAQCLYSPPIDGVDTFYSPRKFVGVADGAFLYTAHRLERSIEKDRSFDRYAHLLVSVDQGIEAGYVHFKKHETTIDHLPLRHMSDLTARSLQAMDHGAIRMKRVQNFEYLHKHLGPKNKLPIDPTSAVVPMIYPFLTGDRLREHCIEQGIFVAQYWADTLGSLEAGTPEKQISEELIALPIDQRWDEKDMDRILKVILK